MGASKNLAYGVLASCLLVPSLVCAEPMAVVTPQGLDATAAALTQAPAYEATPLRLDRSVLARANLARAASELRPPERPMISSIAIVELPRAGVLNTGTPGSQRAHHALSINSEAPARMLRSFGLEASHCATRLRLPSKLRQNSDGVDFQVQAYVGLACRF